MTAATDRDLLRRALPLLQRYRASLLASRSGAASAREQDLVALDALVRAIEAKFGDEPGRN